METLGSILRKAAEPKKVPASATMHLNYRLRKYRFARGESEYSPRPVVQFCLREASRRFFWTAMRLEQARWPWYAEDSGYAI